MRTAAAEVENLEGIESLRAKTLPLHRDQATVIFGMAYWRSVQKGESIDEAWRTVINQVLNLGITHYTLKAQFPTKHDQCLSAIARICQFLGVTVEEFRNKRKFAPVVNARALCCYVLRHYFITDSLTTVGRLLCVDHTTVIAGIRRAPQVPEFDLVVSWFHGPEVIPEVSTEGSHG